MAVKNGKKRRTYRPGWLARAMALLPTSCALLYPWYLAAQLNVVKQPYVSSRLPEAFAGMKIVFLSDIHYGVLFREDRVRSLVNTVNALEPDLILMGGDYAEDSDGAIEFFALHPGFRAKYAVLAAVGNHDRTEPESNLQKLKQAMVDDGVIPLVNDAWMLEKDGKRLAVAGVDDVYNGFPDMEKVRRLCRGADFTLFIPHTPDVVPQVCTANEKPFCDLILCGHTHGGQVTLFGHSVHPTAKTKDRYRSGWFHENGADILVSNGVGTSGFPVRLGAPPQMHLLTLEKRE